MLVVVSSAFGAALVAAMLNISLDVGDKMNRELKSYGANLIVVPKTQMLPVEIGGPAGNPIAAGSLIDEGVVSKIKMIFWRNNIVGFAPYLDASARVGGSEVVPVVGTWFDKQLVIPTGETVRGGVRQIKQWWNIEGEWPGDSSRSALIGRTIARELGVRPGLTLRLSFDGGEESQVDVKVAGVFESGDQDDGKIFLPLAIVQRGIGLQGKVGKIEVSALTTPENELARKAAADPDSLTPKEFETWYCTAYIDAIAYQLEEVLPGVKAKPVRQVSESEGAILQKIQLLVWLLTVAALISSALGISSLMSASILERREEIGLSKAIGAEDRGIILPFLAEAAVLGLFGGLLGYGAGILLAEMIAMSTFGTEISLKLFVFPVTVLLSIAIVWISSSSAIATIIKLSPREVLHGR